MQLENQAEKLIGKLGTRAYEALVTEQRVQIDKQTEGWQSSSLRSTMCARRSARRKLRSRSPCERKREKARKSLDNGSRP